MELYVKMSFISTFSLFFWFSSVILTEALTLFIYYENRAQGTAD